MNQSGNQGGSGTTYNLILTHSQTESNWHNPCIINIMTKTYDRHHPGNGINLKGVHGIEQRISKENERNGGRNEI